MDITTSIKHVTSHHRSSPRGMRRSDFSLSIEQYRMRNAYQGLLKRLIMSMDKGERLV